MVRRRWILWLAAVGVLGGCSVGPAPAEGVLPSGESLGELRQQAREALARYDQTVIADGGSGPVSVSPRPWKSPPGIAIDSAAGSRSGTRLTVSFIGARGPATQSCGADYHAESVESANAVVVIVIAQRHAYKERCLPGGNSRIAALNLTQPLGQRAVLEVRQGKPVPVTIN